MKKSFLLLSFALFLFSCADILQAAAPEKINAGFRTIGIWNNKQNMHLDINVWYPSKGRQTEHSYTPWTIRAARNAAPLAGPFPVLLLSHATPGNRFSYHELAASLARSGYIVVAPTHEGDNMDDMHLLYAPGQIRARVTHLQAALEAILADEKLGPCADREQIGVIGFRSGGTAALAIAGAHMDPKGWKNYCSAAEEDEQYCTPWARRRIDYLAEHTDMNEDLSDMRIKAVAAISPLFGMFLTPKALQGINAETLLVETGEDEHVSKANTFLASRFPKQPFVVRIPQADTGGMMSEFPHSLTWELPELCSSVSKEERTHIMHRLRRELADFFGKVLRSDVQ